MPFSGSRFSNLFAIFCLLCTVWTVVATSTSKGSLFGTYQVKSDCVSPVIQGLTISVSNSTITSPASTTFTTLGFPNATLIIGEANAGTFGGATRVCEIAFRTELGFTDSYLYACADNGEFVCNIFLDTPY